MNFLTSYKLFESRQRKYDDAMYSGGGVYLFQFVSFSIFEKFIKEHEDIFHDVMWALNPLVNKTESCENFYNQYMKRYPIFCVIIDTNSNEYSKSIIGLSMSLDYKQILAVDKKSRKISIEELQTYLDRMDLTIEDLS